MTYTDFENSSHDGAPIEGFFFQGTTKSFHYTNAQKDVVINGVPYQAARIRRTAIKSGTQNDDSLELEIEVPSELEIVKSYAFATSPPDLRLIIYRYHEDSNPAVDWATVWQGPITGFSVKGEIATFRVPSIFEAVLQTNIPNIFYQNQCNHVLYDARCKVVEASFSIITTVTNVSANGLSITVANDGFADNFHKAGTLWLLDKGERRLVLGNVANVVTINFPFFDVANGYNVKLSAGCDHAYQGDCKNKFANTLNYGGFPYIPKENPFDGTL